jgi:plasmid stabilization system protein ParE
MTEPLILAAAEGDYLDALQWYAERSQRAAAGFEKEFERALDAIGTDPERFARCGQQHRYYLMERYPFQVIYRIDRVQPLIVAVAHAAREPGYWSNR